MSTTAEKIKAQAAAFAFSGLKDHGRHLIGPMELRALFQERDQLREENRLLRARLESDAAILELKRANTQSS